MHKAVKHNEGKHCEYILYCMNVVLVISHQIKNSITKIAREITLKPDNIKKIDISLEARMRKFQI